MKHKEGAKKSMGWRKALALLITLVLVCGLAAPAYAEGDQETTEPTGTEQQIDLHTDMEGISDGTDNQNTDADTSSTGVGSDNVSANAADPSKDDTNPPETEETTPVEPTYYESLMAANTCTEMMEIFVSDMTAAASLNRDQLDSIQGKVNGLSVTAEEDPSAKDELQGIVDGLYAALDEDIEDIVKDVEDSKDDASLLADDADIEVNVGSTTTKRGSTAWMASHSWEIIEGSEYITLSGTSSRTVSITGIAEGTATILHTYGSNTETFTVAVTPKPANIVTVQVFVCAQDPVTKERYSQEMFDLLGLKALNNASQNKIWFTVGTVQIDLNQLSNSNQNAYIQTAGDWEIAKAALANLNTQCLDGTSLENRGNAVSEYRDQARVSYGQGADSGYTALFVGNAQPNDFVSGTLPSGTNYHLDLQFNCNKITFKTGNNDIKEGDAKDGTEIDSRTYITGSIIQPPRGGVSAPEGYKVLPGYYKDANFTEEIDPIGQPLNEDMTVYVKIVPLDNAVVNYKVAQGEGTVSVDMESFNPVTESPKGSTATPDSGWAFEGWYSDEACTTKVSSDPTYVPDAPEDGWKENTNLTFWAKFIPATTTVTVSKTVTGGLGDKGKDFSFTVTVKQSENDASFKLGEDEHTGSATFILHDSQSAQLTVPVGSTVTVRETDYSGSDYRTYYSVNNASETEGLEASLTAAAGGNDTIAFRNTKDANPDTGVLLDSLPYVLILAVVAAGVVLMLSRKRRNRDAD